MKKLSQIILEASIKIHKKLGPGLLESVYQNCLIYELEKQEIKCAKEVSIPVDYEELHMETGFRADLIVDEKIIIEIKSVGKLAPAHKAQTLTYLKIANKPLALLINFGAPLLKDGFHRFANGDEANNL